MFGRRKRVQAKQAKLDAIQEKVEEHYEKVMLYAAKKMANHFWRGVKNGPVPGGIQPHDIASEAMSKVVSGARPCPKERSMYDHLCGIASGIIYYKVRNLENQEERIDEESNVVRLHDTNLTPEEIAEKKSELDGFLSFISTYKGGKLAPLTDMILSGWFETARQAAAQLEITPAKVEHLKTDLEVAIDVYRRSHIKGGRA